MKKTMWVLLDDRMGSVGQAKGIIQAIGDKIEVVEKQLVYNKWARLPNFLKRASFIGVNIAKSSNLNEDFPNLILSTSRRTATVALKLKKQSKGKSKIIQLMHPGNFGIKKMDLIIVPEHDAKKCHGSNFFMITGCPHRITDKTVKEAAEKWHDEFKDLPKPWLSVIVGGSIKGHPFGLENARNLGIAARNIVNVLGGSILITTSRRTGAEAEKEIMKQLQGVPMHTFLWGEKKDNPYMGYLSCADKILITGDSVSMCSEACGTGKSALIFCGKGWLTKKHMRFAQSLVDGNYATMVDDPNALSFKPKHILNTSEKIAKKILEIR